MEIQLCDFRDAAVPVASLTEHLLAELAIKAFIGHTAFDSGWLRYELDAAARRPPRRKLLDRTTARAISRCIAGSV